MPSNSLSDFKLSVAQNTSPWTAYRDEDGSGETIGQFTGTTGFAYISVGNGETVSHAIVRPMISDNGGTFEPYHQVIGETLNEVKSGLTDLQNDVEGAWEEITLTDVLTIDQSTALNATNSKVYRRGKHIRTLLDFTGNLTFGADGSHTIVTIKTGYKPVYSHYSNCVVNTSTGSGRVFGTGIIGIFTSGNVNLYANKVNSSIGNSTYSWSAGFAVILEWEIA